MRTRQAKNTQQYLSQKDKLIGEFPKFEIDIHAPKHLGPQIHSTINEFLYNKL